MIVEKLQLYGDDMLISNYKSEDTASTGSEVSATKAAICSMGWDEVYWTGGIGVSPIQMVSVASQAVTIQQAPEVLG